MAKSILGFLLIIFCSFQAPAQTSRFSAGVVGGLNFAELEGNDLTDYFGLNVGLLGAMRLSKKTQLGLEFLFSQNGEYILPTYYPNIQYGKIQLNHLEIPVYLDWLLSGVRNDKSYSLHLNVGLAYARLMNYKVESIEKIDVSEQIIYSNKEAYLMQVGTTYNLSKKIGLNLKATLPIRREALDWTLAARVVYVM
ncbi:MAG TPA: outer membrane beta-barrel protein [Haliscomenobacter sp.]|uniref:outer membrane beta-barrel protein n=1 Tax=Haliscomenobacter sp. TaxID=2717303 RepID=UPI002CD8B606|nr:outer membrane beta-barrel protein [Haliscomenobacter sp.]HOY16015.1 outer membrane beta-barrel protein [Haliscomenobacter sp.]HPH17305.1 outer membrane beta-barrel protein [Haliscomenobacter sp.]